MNIEMRWIVIFSTSILIRKSLFKGDVYELLNLNSVISEIVFVSDSTYIIIALEKNENKSKQSLYPFVF